MWNLKSNINEQTKQKQTRRYREYTGRMFVGLGEEGEGISQRAYMCVLPMDTDNSVVMAGGKGMWGLGGGRQKGGK